MSSPDSTSKTTPEGLASPSGLHDENSSHWGQISRLAKAIVSQPLVASGMVCLIGCAILWLGILIVSHLLNEGITGWLILAVVGAVAVFTNAHWQSVLVDIFQRANSMISPHTETRKVSWRVIGSIWLVVAIVFSGIRTMPFQGTSTTVASRIEAVLNADVRLSANAKSIAEIVQQMRLINTRECPADFQEAYLEHVHAWDAVRALETKAEQFNEHANSSETMVNAFLRGFLGDPLGEFNDHMKITNQLREEFQRSQVRIQESYQNVERVAVRYGAQLPTRSRP